MQPPIHPPFPSERLNTYICNASKKTTTKEKRRILGLCLGLGGEAGHERGGGIAGVVLLDEADRGVDEEQRDDPDEVLPVRRSPLHARTHERDHTRTRHSPTR